MNNTYFLIYGKIECVEYFDSDNLHPTFIWLFNL